MAFQKPVEEWNTLDLERFFDKEFAEKYSSYLGNTQLLSECIERLSVSGDADVLSTLQTLNINVNIHNAMNDVSKVIEKYTNKEMSDEELTNDLLTRFKSDDKFIRSTAYVTMISLLPDFDLSKYKEDIMNTMSELKIVICALVSKCEVAYDLLSYYSVIEDISNLIYPLREKYFAAYSEDIVDDSDHNLEACVDLINNWALELQEEALRNASEETPNIDKELGEQDE